MQFAGCVEVHHLSIGFIVVNNFTRLHSLIHHLGNFKHFLNSVALSLIQLFGVELDARLALEQLADLANERDTVFLILNVVADVGFRVVTHGEPEQNVSNQFEVGVPKILHRNISVVT